MNNNAMLASSLLCSMHGGQTKHHHISRYRHEFYSRIMFMIVITSTAAGALIFLKIVWSMTHY